ncbi:hypothetical protein [Adlercreutzia sp.]
MVSLQELFAFCLMKIYTSKEIKYSLEKAGFTHIETNKNAKGWLCVVARK